MQFLNRYYIFVESSTAEYICKSRIYFVQRKKENQRESEKREEREKLFKSIDSVLRQKRSGDKDEIKTNILQISAYLTVIEDGREACDDKEERVSRVRAPTSKAKDLRVRTSDQSRPLDIGKYPLWPPECWSSSPRCTRVASTPSAVYKLTRIICVSVPMRFHLSTRLIKSDVILIRNSAPLSVF